MKFTATQVAAVLQGKIEGDENTVISDLAKIEEGKAGALCFLSNEKYESYLYTTEASIVIVAKDLELKEAVKPTLIRVKDPYTAFATLLSTYEAMTKVVKSGISEKASVAKTARIGNDVYIGDYAVIDEHARIENGAQIFPNTYVGQHARVGEGSLLYANVNVYTRCVIGKNCIVHSGSVIGSDGFGHAPQADGSFQKIPQLGNVILEDNVELGANCTIDRATLGSTVIKEGAKLDNLIQVGHNAIIGENTVIAAQAGISGTTKIGKNNMIGGQAGIVGHISTAAGVKIQAQSGVGKKISEANVSVSGTPADEYRATLKSQVIFRKLPEMAKKIEALEQKLKDLDNQA
jgi:UDP-3-O-[3-hydroxymyristoyl] glucosamine N-acyltransferase